RALGSCDIGLRPLDVAGYKKPDDLLFEAATEKAAKSVGDRLLISNEFTQVFLQLSFGALFAGFALCDDDRLVIEAEDVNLFGYGDLLIAGDFNLKIPADV